MILPAICFSFFLLGCFQRSEKKTITINYTLGNTIVASSAVTLFPSASFYYLTIEYEIEKKVLRMMLHKKRLSFDDSIDKWQMVRLGAIKKPTSNCLFSMFAGDLGAQKTVDKIL
jgi:hypothetical protein